jgi:peptidoglycan/xylan/chitin deacetylase (PgdA/CDA1 family)
MYQPHAMNLRALLRRTASPTGGPLVLTYHRIAAGRDPLGQCVHPERFAEHLAVLRVSAEIVPLHALSDGGRSSRRVALTFDDGYRCNAETAAPLLRAHAAAATFFVPSRVLTDRSEYWWDRLEHAHFDYARDAATVDIEIDGRRVRIDVRDDAGRLRSIKALSRRLRRLPLGTIDALVATIVEQLGAETTPACDAHALLDTAALQALAADPLFELGSHGVSHTMLTALSPVEQELELAASRAELAPLAGAPPTSVAYPFGTPDATDSATFRAAAACGYRRGYLNTPGRIDLRRAPLAQPRHMVHDWPATQFAAQLESWFGAQ